MIAQNSLPNVNNRTGTESISLPVANSLSILPRIKHDNSHPHVLSKYYSSHFNTLSKKNDNVIYFSTHFFEEAIKKTPIISHAEQTGDFIGLSGYSYNNSNKINEDKLDININYSRESKKISLFSIYDGHGSAFVSSYINNHLQKEIINNSNIVSNTRKAILNSFEKVESDLLQLCLQSKNDSQTLCGSCALIIISIDHIINVVNLGNSRAFLCTQKGQKIYSLTTDHLPSNEIEKQRILLAGGIIKTIRDKDRIFPGGLSVTRSFGDFDCKLPQIEAKPNAIVSIPDILSFENKSDMDFMFLGCEGIYRVLSHKHVVKLVYVTMRNCVLAKNTYEEMLQKIIYNINEKIISKGLMKNLTCVFLPFKSFQETFIRGDIKEINEIILYLHKTQMTGNRLYEDLIDSISYKYSCCNKIMTGFSSIIDLKKRSILTQANIRFYEQSFNKSSVSFEWKKIELSEDNGDYETSDCTKTKESDGKKTKKNRPYFNCCGILII